MCYNPITIKNNSKSSTLHTSFIRVVPCGKCCDCISKYQNEWFVRAKYHFDYYQSIGGCTCFITLTYNDANLPRYKDTYFVNGVEKTLDIPVFDKHDIQLFIKYCRRWAKDNLGYSTDDCNKITQIFCSEYGSKYTQRSHYHGLLFLPHRISIYDLRRMLAYSWSYTEFIDNNRKKPVHYLRGFFSFGKHGAFVTSETALRYCMKYTSKDMAGADDIHNLKEYCESNFKNYDKIKPHLPFHLQSRGFGAHALDVLSDDDFIKGYITASQPDARGNIQTFPIPQYIKRRKFTSKPLVQNNARCGMFVYNSEYFRLLPQILEYQLKERQEKLCDLFKDLESFTTLFNSSADKYEHLFSFFNKHIKSRLEDYVCYEKLLNYTSNSYPLYPDETSFSLLLSIIRAETRAHNIKVNTNDLTEIRCDREEVPSTYKKLDRDFNPFWVDPEHNNELFESGKLLFGWNETYRKEFEQNNTFYLPNSFVYTEHPTTKYVDVGKPRLRSKHMPWYERNKYHVSKIRDSISWDSYPRFAHFALFKKLLDAILQTRKKNESERLYKDMKKSKEIKDNDNERIYGRL